MKDIVVVGATGRWPQPFKPQVPILAPGTYAAMEARAALSVDLATGEDWMAMAFATLSRTGTVLIEDIIRLPRQKPTIRSLYDMVPWERLMTPRNKRNRHHKRKGQPNCGPRSKNTW